MYYYGARYYDPRISIFASVDPLAEQFVGWTPYHYVHNNPIMFTDPTGMSATTIDGEDIIVNRDSKGKVTGVERVYTGGDTPNRLFVQDPSATSETPNRYERSGKFYEQQMIPSSEYTEADYKPINGNLNNPSQFDRDRNDYIYKSGVDYTDSSWYNRLGESLMDDPVTSEDIQTVISRRTSGGSKLSTSLCAKKGFQGGKQKDRDKTIFNYPQDFRRWFHRQYKKWR